MPEKKEIDEFARLVRSRGQIELRELASALGKTEKQTERLAHILEDLGRIRIDYRVTGIYFVWVGEVFSREEEREPEKKEKEEIEEEKIEMPALPQPKTPRLPREAQKTNNRKKEARAESEARRAREVVGDAGVHIRTEVDEIMRRVREAGRISLGTLAREMKKDVASIEKWVYFLEEQGVLEIESSLRERHLIWKGVPEEKRYERVLFQTGFEREAGARTGEESAELRELRRINSELAEKMRSVIDELNELRRANAELEMRMKTSAREVGAKAREAGKVEKRIESLREKYIPLEKEFEQEINVLSEKLAEKEKKIGELKARIAALPKEIENIEKEIGKVRALEKSEARELIDAKARVWNLSSKLRALEERMREKGVDEELIGELVEAEAALSKLEGVDRILEKQESAERERMGEITRMLKTVEGGLRAVRKSVGGKFADAFATKVERVGVTHGRGVEKIKTDKESALRELKEAIKRKEGAGEKAKEWDGT